MASQQIPILSPSKGVVRAVPREGQPQDTCWDAVNMLPWDRYGRKRLAQRPGIKKQFNQYAGNNTQFIQGLIEAPNIIYPPGVWTVPLPGVNNLGVFPITTPATSGPVLAGVTPFGFTLEYEFDFAISYAATFTPSGGPPWSSGSAAVDATFFFPLNGTGTSTLSLILLFSGGGILTDNSGGGSYTPASSSIAGALYHGIPSAGSGTWTQIGTTAMVTQAGVDGNTTVSWGTGGVLTINNQGVISLILGGQPSVGGTYGIWVDAPLLNLLSVTNSTPANTVQTLNVSD